MINLIESDSSIPKTRACDALVLNRSTLYARQSREEITEQERQQRRKRNKTSQPRALSKEERTQVLKTLNSEEFNDQPPLEVYHTLLERGENPCSISTMHRILRENRQSSERRQQRTAQHHAIPRLKATKPNEVWTWDCSKLATSTRGVYLTLYVVLDLFSRFVVAWMVSSKENSALAQQLMNEAALRYSIMPDQLTIHQDRGSPMIAHRYIDQMHALGIMLSHSRPRVSNDNAFSESQFRTQKYQPDYPGCFESISHATQWNENYFDWYNFDHHHSGLAGYTPEQVFTGRYLEMAKEKQRSLDQRYERNPERFVKGRPHASMPAESVEINPITAQDLEEGVSNAVNFPTLTRVKEKYNLFLK